MLHADGNVVEHRHIVARLRIEDIRVTRNEAEFLQICLTFNYRHAKTLQRRWPERLVALSLSLFHRLKIISKFHKAACTSLPVSA